MAKFYIVVPFNDLKGRRQADHVQQFLVQPSLVFTDLETANRHAEHLATRTVGVDVFIFEATESIVASNPKFSRKAFNAAGELRPKASAA